MADAVKDLNNMIERIRAEAFSAGYKKGYGEGVQTAIAALADLAKAPVIHPRPEPYLFDENLNPAPAVPATRAPRGTNNSAVLEAMTALGAPTGIKSLQDFLWHKQERRIAYSSLQNALAQLDRDGKARQIARGVWELGDSADIPAGAALSGPGDFA